MKDVFEILDKMQFFQGQRAGRELWGEKPKEVQDEDIKSFNDDIDCLREHIKSHSIPVWTPCDKGLPDYGVKCNVTVYVDIGDGASDVFVPTFAMHHNGVDWYDEDGYDYSHFKVLAWQPLSKPYNPDQFRDPTQKADHIVDPNKMVQEA